MCIYIQSDPATKCQIVQMNYYERNVEYYTQKPTLLQFFWLKNLKKKCSTSFSCFLVLFLNDLAGFKITKNIFKRFFKDFCFNFFGNFFFAHNLKTSPRFSPHLIFFQTSSRFSIIFYDCTVFFFFIFCRFGGFFEASSLLLNYFSRLFKFNFLEDSFSEEVFWWLLFLKGETSKIEFLFNFLVKSRSKKSFMDLLAIKSFFLEEIYLWLSYLWNLW